RWAKQEGARVISCSVIMPSWSDGQGGGAMHRALTALLGPGTAAADPLCFASAGNTTERHWAGPFHDRGDGWHCWQAQPIDNALRRWAGEDTVHVELYGRHTGSYEVCVFDTDTGKEVGRAASNPQQTDRLSAAVRFAPQADHSYSVRVRHLSGP